MFWKRTATDLEKGPPTLGEILRAISNSASPEEQKTAKMLATFVAEEVRRRLDDKVYRPQGYFIRFASQYKPRTIRAVISRLRWRLWDIEEVSGDNDTFRIILSRGGTIRPLETINID